MMFYHLAFVICGVVQGHSPHCEAEKMIDTKYYGLVNCYAAANRLDEQITREFTEEAKSQGDKTASVEVKARCLSIDEGEEFLKQNGASALVVTGKRFE